MLLPWASASGQDNLIVNGGFETFVVGPNDIDFGEFVRCLHHLPTLYCRVDKSAEAAVGNPNNVDLTHSSKWPAFAGTQSLDMEGDVGTSG